MNARLEVGTPADALMLQIDGVRLAVTRAGRGPALVCLHAIGHGARDYEAFLERVQDRYEVIRIDWPGQGRSGVDTQPPSAARYAQLLAGVLDALRIERPTLIGNSIGGAAALLLAQRRPLRALVLCNAGGLVPVNGFVRAFCAVFAWFFGAGARGAGWFKPAFRFYYRRLVLPSAGAAAQRERIIASGYEIAAVLQQAWRSFGRADADLRQVAIGLELPVWVAWARHDRVIPLRLCLPCISRMRNAQLTRYDGGHAAFLERPAAFAEDFLAFMRGVEGDAAQIAG